MVEAVCIWKGVHGRANIKKNISPPLTTTMVENEAFFMLGQIVKGQSKNCCDEKSKLQACQSESSRSRPNSDDGKVIHDDKVSRSTIVVVRWRGASFFHYLFTAKRLMRWNEIKIIHAGYKKKCDNDAQTACKYPGGGVGMG